MAEALAPVLETSVLETSLIPLIVSLATDPVPNVRFNVAKVGFFLSFFTRGAFEVPCEG